MGTTAERMAMGSKGAPFAMTGDIELRAALLSLARQPKKQEKAIRFIMRVAGKPLLQELRKTPGLKQQTKNLSRSFAFIKGKSKKMISEYIGPRVAKTASQAEKNKQNSKGTRKGYHAYLLEYGTAERKQKGGRKTGKIQAYGFVNSAIDKTQQAIGNRIANGTAAKIVQQIKTNPNFKFRVTRY